MSFILRNNRSRQNQTQMASDIGNDNFDYGSKQDYSIIDHKIALFEYRQSMKNGKTKQKARKPLCSVPIKTLKSHPTVIKSKCMSYTQTPKAEPKPFRYVRYPEEESAVFECDREFQVIEQTPILTSSTVSKEGKQPNRRKKRNRSSQKLEARYLANFSSFRRHFYNVTRNLITSSLDKHPFIRIADIRLASVSETVQEDFLKALGNYSYFPQLVYHGTDMNNIKSILQHGLLIPGREYPSNLKAPAITSRNGQAFGSGIYCSWTVIHSLQFTHETNTVLVCSALPKRRGPYAALDGCHSDVLVLREESRVIPLFLFDVKYLKAPQTNYPWFDYEKKVVLKEKKQVVKTNVVSRKYLRKVLGCMNDDSRKNDLYQLRQYESIN